MGVPLFFLFKGGIGTTAAAMVMIVVMLPGFLFGVYEKNGQPLEVVGRQIIESCISAAPRSAPIRPSTHTTPLCVNIKWNRR